MQLNPGVAFAEGVVCSPAGVADEEDNDTCGAVVAAVTLSTVPAGRGAAGEGSGLGVIEAPGTGAFPEDEEACEAVGVDNLTILDHPDGQLEYGLDLRRDIASHIREIRPDTVITANFELEAYGSFNQADHRVTGLAVVDAIRDADNPWVFTYLDQPAWKVIRLLIAAPGEPTHRMRVDDEAVRAGIESLSRHERYLAELPDHPKPAEFVPMMLEQPDGQSAVSFRVFDPV